MSDPLSIEQRYRVYLWLNHGHEGLYGDDGEMQCSACAPFGLWDYKREPLERVEATVAAVKQQRILALLPAPPDGKETP